MIVFEAETALFRREEEVTGDDLDRLLRIVVVVNKRLLVQLLIFLLALVALLHGAGA